MARQAGTDAAAIALTRFGLGARPGEMRAVASDPRGWLEAQVTPAGAAIPAGRNPDSRRRLVEYHASREREGGDAAAVLQARRDARQRIKDDVGEAFTARASHAVATPQGFAERWALFWSNALTVSASRFDSGAFAPQYEREAIRPNVFGRFEDLLLAAERHPAMLLYLDQVRSVGPGSRTGERRGFGLNENLAREALELHTLGADGGDDQGDVAELARALTGWNIRRPRAADDEPAFAFLPDVHEPGGRTVLGVRYPEGGAEQAERILRDLAGHPATGRRLARRIAAHFVADEPPPALVAALERAWRDSGGDLAVVARTLVAAPEAWAPAAAKIKTPYELIVSAYRAVGASPGQVPRLHPALIRLGQTPFSPPSPEGWPDTAADWVGPDALVKRLDWAQAFAAEADVAEPARVAESALGGRLSDRTREAVRRAESRKEALTLLVMSPEFQRR